MASSFVPFTRGGDATLVDGLIGALRSRGHEVETILLPFSSDPEVMIEQMLAFRLLDVKNAGERLIAVRWPSYLLRHPSKVVWFIHHHRPAYDLWETPWHTDESVAAWRMRDAIMGADHFFLRETRAVYANSEVVSQRLRRFNAIDSKVLYPPLPEGAQYREGNFDGFVFAPGRISPIKRQELLVRAMAHVRSGVRLVLAGPPDVPDHLERLQSEIDEAGVAERVELRPNWISEQEKRDLFSRCLGCAYVPYDEDSYGFVTLEAFESGKPVVTCDDSGGTLALVEDDVTGTVCPPEPEQLAAAFDALYDDRERAKRLGRAGRERIRALGISWDTVVERLLK